MEFEVDASLQKQLMKETRKIYKGTGFLWICEKAILLLTIGGLIWHLIKAVLTGYIYVTLNGQQVFDTEIIFEEVLIAIEGIFFWFCIWLARKRVEIYHGTLGRDGIVVKIMDDKLFYSSRFTEEKEDVVHLLIMDLRTTTKIIYDEKKRVMFLQGKMLERAVAVTKDEEDVVYDENEMVQTMFELFDCFTPSIYEYLKSYLPEGVIEHHKELSFKEFLALEQKTLRGE